MFIYEEYYTNTPKRLARWLDRPLFPWKRLVVGFSLAEFALENWLLFRQYRVLQRTSVPKALNKEINTETFDKSQVRTCTSMPLIQS
jgi:STE24 endopeptidase